MRYGPSYYETSMAETYRMAMAETYLRRYREPARGGLTIQAVPPIAQVFVDGHYVGLAEEFGPGGGAIMLNDGAHRVELRAPDYETLTFSVKIEPNGLVRYRGDMQRIATKPAAAVPSQPRLRQRPRRRKASTSYPTATPATSRRQARFPKDATSRSYKRVNNYCRRRAQRRKEFLSKKPLRLCASASRRVSLAQLVHEQGAAGGDRDVLFAVHRVAHRP